MAHANQNHRPQSSNVSFEYYDEPQPTTEQYHLTNYPSTEWINQSYSAGLNQTPVTTPPRTIKAFDSWTRFLIWMSFVLLIITVVFLSWMWFADHSTETWRRLMVSSYAAQAITVSAVLIRTALATLAFISTSMIASVLLESRGVPLDVVLPLSIARFTNNGPLSLTSLSYTPSVMGLPLLSLIAFLLVSILASQFSSTLLVYDLGPLSIMNFTAELPNAYKMFPLKSRNYQDIPIEFRNSALDYLFQRPTVFATFAEYTQEVATPEDVDDTGFSIRALLPFASQAQREQIRRFQGAARVIDSRVVCVRPTITNARLCGEWIAGHKIAYEFCGTMKRQGLPKHSWVRPSNGTYENGFNVDFTETEFRCNVIVGWYTPQQFHWSLCKMSRGSFYVLSPLTNATTYGEWHPSVSTVLGDNWIVLNTGSMWDQLKQQNYTQGTWKTLNTSEDGPWAKQRLEWSTQEEVPDFQSKYLDFSATWCSEADPSAPVAYLNITASSETPLKEPVWRIEDDQKSFDTISLRQQLGGTSAIPTRRPKLTIMPADMEQSLATVRGMNLSSPSAIENAVEEMNWLGSRSSTPPAAKQILFTPEPMYDNGTFLSQVVKSVDPLMCSIFADTLNDTRSPARALQAFRTTQYRTIYYDLMGSFISKNTTARIDTFATVLAPVRRVGYGSVMGIICANLLVFFICFWLFRRHCQWSMLDNSWSAIAQVGSHEDVQTVLGASRAMTDTEVKKWVDQGTMPSNSAGIVRQDGVKTAILTFLYRLRQRWNSRPVPNPQKPEDIRYIIRDGVVVRKVAKLH